MPRDTRTTSMHSQRTMNHKTRPSHPPLTNTRHGSDDVISKSASKEEGRTSNKTIQPLVTINNKLHGVTSDDGAEFGGHDVGASKDAEADDSEDDSDKPKAFAPSGASIKHQPGLQHAVSSFQSFHESKKRTLSIGSEDSEIIQKPTKIHKSVQSSQIGYEASDDDDDYNAVDLISDCEEEGPTIEKLEENLIIESEKERDEGFASQSIAKASLDDEWEGFDLANTGHFSDLSMFEEQMERIEYSALTDDTDFFDPTIDIESTANTSPGRRVHFADDLFAGSTNVSRTTFGADSDSFSALFVQQDDLDPDFRRQIENDDDEDVELTSHKSKSKKDKDRVFKTPLEGGEKSHSGSESLSGYETDAGDTTDEEILPPTTVNRPEKLLRRNSLASSQSWMMPPPAFIPTKRGGRNLPGRRAGPRMGSFTANPAKPYAILATTSAEIVVVQAGNTARKFTPTLESSVSSANVSPRVKQSTTYYVYGSNVDIINASKGGASDHQSESDCCDVDYTYPELLPGSPAEIIADFMRTGGLFPEDEQEESPGVCFDMAEYLDLGQSSDDKEDDDESELGRSHLLDTNVVSSFRRNQNRHESLLRRPYVAASTNGLNGIKCGSQAATKTLLGPLRMHRHSRSLGSTSSLGAIGTKVISKGHKRRVSGF